MHIYSYIRDKSETNNTMKGKYLGEFEELVLLSTAILHKDAHSLSIQTELEKQSGRSPLISTVHKVLVRLEDKGLLTSYLGGATKKRGGRRKRLYQLTIAGKKALSDSKELRNNMWASIPQVAWEGGQS